MTKKRAKEIALEIIGVEEFEPYINENGKIALRDLQYANLGDIESEEFDDLSQVIDRLEIYHDDYYVNGLIDCLREEYDVDLWNYTDIYNYIVKNKIYKDMWEIMYILTTPKALEKVMI